jgi:hypothetical protein
MVPSLQGFRVFAEAIFESQGLRVFVLDKQVLESQHDTALGSRKSHESKGFCYQTLAVATNKSLNLPARYARARLSRQSAVWKSIS